MFASLTGHNVYDHTRCSAVTFELSTKYTSICFIHLYAYRPRAFFIVCTKEPNRRCRSVVTLLLGHKYNNRVMCAEWTDALRCFLLSARNCVSVSVCCGVCVRNQLTDAAKKKTHVLSIIPLYRNFIYYNQSRTHDYAYDFSCILVVENNTRIRT